MPIRRFRCKVDSVAVRQLVPASNGDFCSLTRQRYLGLKYLTAGAPLWAPSALLSACGRFVWDQQQVLQPMRGCYGCVAGPYLHSDANRP